MRSALTALFLLSTYLSFAQMQRIDSIPQNGIVLNKGWKFHPGDNAAWAKPDFNDSGWQAIDPTLDVSYLPQMRQQPIGWLRIHFQVDSSLLNKPLAYHIFQSIASQVYINGVLTDSFGVVSSDKNKIEEWRPSNDPEGIVFTQTGQTVAVRFSLGQKLVDLHLVTPFYGFVFRTKPINSPVKNYELPHQFPYQLAVLIGFYTILCVLHLILYFYQPQKKANLDFSILSFFFICGGLLVLYIYFGDTSLFNIKIAQNFCYFQYTTICDFLLYLAIRHLFFHKKSIVFWIIIGVIIVTPAIVFLAQIDPIIWSLVILSLTSGEATRITYLSYKNGNRKAGILLIAFCIYWTSLFIVVFYPNQSNTYQLTDFFWTLSTVSIPLSLTIYLSIDFANTSKELEKKLVEIKELSNEKQQILLSQNETLEQKVIQRTSQLNQSIHELKITQAKLLQSEQRQSLQINRLNEEVLSRTEEVNTMKQTLASDFHDETGNLLSAITRQASLLKMNDGYTQKGATVIDNIIANSNQLYASSRHFLWNLNNDSNDPHKLFEYLLSFGQNFYNSFGISFSADNHLPADFPGRLLPFAPLNLIFIFKEAMNNVAKHAGAAEVILEVTRQKEFIVFSLVDDGTWQEPDINTTHHGLHNMERRCAQNKFCFAISHPGITGTRIEVGAPFIINP